MEHHLNLYLNPTGRVSRRTWHLQTGVILAIGALGFVLTTFILTILDAFSFPLLVDLFPRVLEDRQDEPFLPMVMRVSAVIVTPAVIWCWIAVTVKRLHDQDRSATWLFLLLLPVIGWIVLFILVIFIPGTEASNRYGSQHSYTPQAVRQPIHENHYLNLYFNPTGRVSRCTWWLHYVVISHFAPFAIAMVITFVTFIIGPLVGFEPATSYLGGLNIGVILMIVGFVWFYFSFTIKRLHDQDRSAWWMLLPLIPLIGGIILLILAAFWPGTKDINRYGPQPQTHASRQ